MAKAKQDLFDQAQQAGIVAADASSDDYTAAQLEALLSGDRPAAGWVASARKPIVAPDGHVTLSQEDIDNYA